MDPVQQIEVRDLMMIKPKTNPKPINGRVHFHAVVLLHLFVTILLFAYFLPGLRCYFRSVNYISSAELAKLLVSKKALFLFSNFILILLVIDFTLSAGTSNSFTNTLHNDHDSASLEGHLPYSDSNAIVVGDAHAAEEQLHDDDSLWKSSSLQVEELITSEQKGTISVDSFAEEKQLSAKEESITNIDILFVDFGDDITEWRSEYSNKSQQGRRMITVEGGGPPTPTLEVVVMDGSTNGQGRTQLEAFVDVADELERLELDELNRKFDEFIQREKNKWRSETLKLVMAV